MAKLKLGAIEGDKPVKFGIEFPSASRPAGLCASARPRDWTSRHRAGKLIPTMFARFMATYKTLARDRRARHGVVIQRLTQAGP